VRDNVVDPKSLVSIFVEPDSDERMWASIAVAVNFHPA
jgi:hypothetical protein